MKQLFKWIFCIMLFSCSTDTNLLEDVAVRGGFIVFDEIPLELNYNFLDLADFQLNARLEDPNNNATSYSLTLISDGIEVPDFIVLNSFPASLDITIPMLVDALGISESDLEFTDEFRFFATVITPTGTYIFEEPDFNDENENEGGNTANNLFRTGYANQAMDFTIRFFVPPPQKLRGTSFEEPLKAVNTYPEYPDYVRTGANNEEGFLENHTDQPYVTYTAVGSGVDDEIGFTSEFIDIGDSGNGFHNEEIGVTDKLDEVIAYQDGVQGFQVEDVDGLFRLTFDTVNIPSGNPSTGVQMQIFFRVTGWEDDDFIHVYALVERSGGTETIDLMNIDGDDIDEGLEGRWLTIDTGFLLDVEAYTLTVDLIMDSGNEDVYLDRMLVYVPTED